MKLAYRCGAWGILLPMAVASFVLPAAHAAARPSAPAALALGIVSLILAILYEIVARSPSLWKRLLVLSVVLFFGLATVPLLATAYGSSLHWAGWAAAGLCFAEGALLTGFAVWTFWMD